MITYKSKLNLYPQITYDTYQSLNIFSKYRLLEKYKSNIQYYFSYEISPTDRWDNLANRFYGSVDLWWVIAIFNNVIDPYEYLQEGNTLNIIKSEFISDILLTLRRFQLDTK